MSRKIQYSELYIVSIVRNTSSKYFKKKLLFLLSQIVWLELQKLIFMASRTDILHTKNWLFFEG